MRRFATAVEFRSWLEQHHATERRFDTLFAALRAGRRPRPFLVESASRDEALP